MLYLTCECSRDTACALFREGVPAANGVADSRVAALFTHFFMKDLAEIFKNSIARKTIRDYTQFQTVFLTSPRGGGKTYPTQEYLLDGVLKRGERFGYIRGDAEELKFSLRTGFWDVALTEKHPECTFETVGNFIYVNGEAVGVGISLSTYHKMRGAALNLSSKKITKDEETEYENAVNFSEKYKKHISRSFFDEFEALTKTAALKGEARVQEFLHCAESLFRMRDGARAILCGNLVRGYNAFLSQFNFGETVELEAGVVKKSYTTPTSNFPKPEPLAVWCHLKPSKEWRQARGESYVGKILRGKDEEMFGGTGAPIESAPLITGKPLRRVILFNIKAENGDFTFWRATQTPETRYYITARTQNTTFPTFALNVLSARQGVPVISKTFLKVVLDACETGRVEYDNMKTYTAFIENLPKRRNRDVR